VAAVLWSVVICVVLVWQNPTQVGGGMLGSIVIGAIVYAFIPKSRRGKGAAKTVGARAADLAVLTLEARFPSMAPLGGLFATQRCHRGETERGRCDRYESYARFGWYRPAAVLPYISDMSARLAAEGRGAERLAAEGRGAERLAAMSARLAAERWGAECR
jgi:hypothetical protein